MPLYDGNSRLLYVRLLIYHFSETVQEDYRIKINIWAFMQNVIDIKENVSFVKPNIIYKKTIANYQKQRNENFLLLWNGLKLVAGNGC